MKAIETFVGIEGEGLWTGIPVATIRLAGCNLKCKFCDTSYSWAIGEEISIEDLITFVENAKVEHVSITGGEPLYRRGQEFEELKKFVSLLSVEHDIKVETNGTITPCDLLRRTVNFWSVSPKIGGLGGVFDVETLKVFINMWNVIRQNIQFKFVVDVDSSGLNVIKTVFENSGLGEELKSSVIPVVFHPMALVGDSLEEYRRKYALLSEQILGDIGYWGGYNVRAMLQSHKISFGDKRGK